MTQFNGVFKVAAACASLVGVTKAQDLRVSHTLVADDYFLRPGETTRIYLWVEHSPALGTPIVYTLFGKSYAATVAFHSQTGGGLFFDRPWGDGFKVTGTNFNVPNYGFCSDCNQVYQNGYAFGPIYLNKCFSGMCSPWPPIQNPDWGCYVYFTPLDYEPKQITIYFDSGSYAAMAVEVPELLKTNPFFQLMKWPASDSPPITIQIGPACIADCESDGALDIDDFVCFMTSYSLGDKAKADCDGDSQLTIDDFICFQTSFVLGC
jgi:hypothetical protein